MTRPSHETHSRPGPSCLLPNLWQQQRRYFTRTAASKCQGGWVTQVECPFWGYFMVICAKDGRVLEATHPVCQRFILSPSVNLTD